MLLVLLLMMLSVLLLLLLAVVVLLVVVIVAAAVVVCCHCCSFLQKPASMISNRSQTIKNNGNQPFLWLAKTQSQLIFEGGPE